PVTDRVLPSRSSTRWSVGLHCRPSCTPPIMAEDSDVSAVPVLSVPSSTVPTAEGSTAIPSGPTDTPGPVIPSSPTDHPGAVTPPVPTSTPVPGDEVEGRVTVLSPGPPSPPPATTAGSAARSPAVRPAAQPVRYR